MRVRSVFFLIVPFIFLLAIVQSSLAEVETNPDGYKPQATLYPSYEGFGLYQNEQSAVLNIPPRRQWDNSNGYCGSCSIQQIALYYGSYVSQSVCRRIVNSNLSDEVLVGLNEHIVLDALSLTYERWDWNRSNVWQDHLLWIKRHLINNNPVLFTVYVRGMNDPDYDHIMPAVGVNFKNPNIYEDSDQLIFNDNFVNAPFTRTFSTLPDANYTYALPTQHNYACAVTGIKDLDKKTYPVSLFMNNWDEPNVSLGEAAVQMIGTGQVYSLVPGNTYLLLRFNDYRNVPEKNFLESDYSTSISFVATDEIYSFQFVVLSDGVAIFRCIESTVERPFPPINFSGHKVQNRSLSQIEHIVVLTWAANPENENVTKYKIYLVTPNPLNKNVLFNSQINKNNYSIQNRKALQREENKTLLAELDANTFVYWHRKVELEKSYTYCISAVDDKGYESEALYYVVK